MKLSVLRDHRVVPCADCAFLSECGGMDEQQALWGCFGACSAECITRGCDWTCPASPNDFVERLREVGSLSTASVSLAPMSAVALPSYIPMIHHGYSTRGGGDQFALDAPTAAISIKDVFRVQDGGRVEVVAADAASLRRRFGLRQDCRVLLVCIANDRPLESYWARRRVDDLPIQLEKLGLLGITLPNYSFFTDAPRTHTLWNRRRMLRVGEELSARGLQVVPHLNALTAEDWRFWREFLLAHPKINVVAKEFQTGLREKDKAAHAIDALRRLQDDVGRPLRLIAVGATRYLSKLRNALASVTFVDSAPFMRAMKRRARVTSAEGPQWRKVSVPSGHELLALLNNNIREHAAFIARRVGA